MLKAFIDTGSAARLFPLQFLVGGKKQEKYDGVPIFAAVVV